MEQYSLRLPNQTLLTVLLLYIGRGLHTQAFLWFNKKHYQLWTAAKYTLNHAWTHSFIAVDHNPIVSVQPVKNSYQQTVIMSFIIKI